MKSLSVLRAWHLAFLLIFVPHLAQAQPAQLEPGLAPGEVITTDSAGVDLRSGQPVYSGFKLSVGDIESPALSYFGSRLSQGANGGTPFGSISSTCYASYPGAHCSYYVLNLNLHGTSMQARGGEQYVLDDGSVVLNDNTVRRKDGTIWRFSGRGSVYNNADPYQAYLSKIEYPDGSTLTYAADSATNGGTVTSSYGYRQQVAQSGDSRSFSMTNLSCPTCPAEAFPRITSSSSVDTRQSPSNIYASEQVVGFPVVSGSEIYQGSGKSLVQITTAAGRSIQVKRPPSSGYLTGTDTIIISCPGGSNADWFKKGSSTWTYTYKFEVSGTCQPSETKSTDPENNALTVWGPPGTVNVRDANGRLTTYLLSTRVMRTSQSNGVTMDGSRVLAIIYPEGNRVDYRYLRGVVDKVTYTSKDAQQTRTIEASYPASCSAENAKICNRPISVKDSRDGTTNYEYHAASGQVEKIIAPPDQRGVRAETRFRYEQRSASYYDAPGQLVSGAATWKLIEKSVCATMAGNSCVNTGDETRTTYTYNQNLLPVTIETKAGDGSRVSTVTRTYDPIGNIVTVDGPLPGAGDTVRSFYNVQRWKTGEIAPNPAADGQMPYIGKRLSHDQDGYVTLVEVGTVSAPTQEALQAMSVSESVSSSYDAMGRKQEDRRSAGGSTLSVTQYAYDGTGRLVCTATRMNPGVFGSLPTDACVLGAQGAQGADRIVRNVYDAAGQLVQVRRAVGTPLEQAYATYGYTPNGKQEYVVDANGNRAKLAYDGFDRQSHWYLPSKSKPAAFNGATQATALASAGAFDPADFEQYGYDANGNRTSLRKRDGRTLTFGYDALNRMTSKVVPDGCAPLQAGACTPETATRDVYYGYDLRGLQTYARFDGPTGAEGVSNAYDGFGQLKASTISMGGVARTLSYGYDANGNRTGVTHPDLTAFAYEYDGVDRPIRIRENGAAQIAGMSYDAQGRLVGDARGAVASVYGYDPIGRLETLSTDLSGSDPDFKLTTGCVRGGVAVGFSYNPAGQITCRGRAAGSEAYGYAGYVNLSRSYAVNGLNQYGSAGPASFGYDANGNLISDGATAYVYDAENRLVSAANGTTLTYDPLGRLWQVTGGGRTTQFVYDGDALSLEYDGGGALLRRYVHGNGADDPLVWYEGAGLGTRRSLHVDHQGSVVAVADGSGGAYGLNSYDEYGIPGSTNRGRFQYTGQAWLPELEMYHYKARIYSPTLGRFLQTDPIGYDDQVNLYAYVGNDPVNGRDPTGTYTCGPSMSAAQCNTFMARQKEAIAQIKGQISAMKGLQASLQNGTKLTGAQQQLASRLNAYVGPKAGSNPGTIGSVIKAGQNMLSGLQGNKQFQASPVANGTTYATNNPITTGKLYPSFFTSSSTMQRQTVAHESGHETAGVRDRRYDNGIGPYGNTNARAIARYGPEASLTNADNLAYAFGFQRDDE